MRKLLQDGLTASIWLKLFGLGIACLIGMGLSVAAVLNGWVTEPDLLVASLFGFAMGVVGLIVAGGAKRLLRSE